MNKRKEKYSTVVWLALVLLGALLLAGCSSRLRVGELKTESQSVELGDAKPVNVEINFGAGDLRVNGGAEKLLEANFTYNVARLKPEVESTDDRPLCGCPKTKVCQPLETSQTSVMSGICALTMRCPWI